MLEVNVNRSRPCLQEAAASLRELAALGLEPRVRRLGSGLVSTGVAAGLDMAALLDTRRPGDAALGSIYAALAARVPVTVTIDDPARVSVTDAMAEFRERCFAFLSRDAVDRALLGLCLHDTEIPPAHFRDTIRTRLGAGARYVSLGAVDGADDADVWDLLKRSTAGPAPLWPVFPAAVQSRCPLLPSEPCNGVVPLLGLSAPFRSAWLPIDLDVMCFVEPSGQLNLTRLDRALATAVACGDCLLDALRWFGGEQRKDARDNRRLAIRVLGFGDLLERRRMDPSALRSLEYMDRFAGYLHDALWAESRRLAAARGPLPALTEYRAKTRWRDDARSRAWLDRWRRAVARVAVRNRSLLTLSPYTLLPRAAQPSAGFADLLPVLLHADAVSFADPPSFSHWNLNEFRGFYKRTRAVIARRNATAFVATGA